MQGPKKIENSFSAIRVFRGLNREIGSAILKGLNNVPAIFSKLKIEFKPQIL